MAWVHSSPRGGLGVAVVVLRKEGCSTSRVSPRAQCPTSYVVLTVSLTVLFKHRAERLSCTLAVVGRILA